MAAKGGGAGSPFRASCACLVPDPKASSSSPKRLGKAFFGVTKKERPFATVVDLRTLGLDWLHPASLFFFFPPRLVFLEAS